MPVKQKLELYNYHTYLFSTLSFLNRQMYHKLNIPNAFLCLNSKTHFFLLSDFLQRNRYKLHIIISHITKCDIIPTYKIDTLTMPI